MEYKEVFEEGFDFLVDEYLNNCVFVGITSQWFANTFSQTTVS